MATLAEKRESRFRRRGEAEAEKQRQLILKKTGVVRLLLDGRTDEVAIRTLECMELIEEMFKEKPSENL